MDWENERYVRLYTRNTADDLALCWQAWVLWPRLLAIADQAGFIHVKQGERRLKLLAALVRVPLDFVQVAMPDLLEDGRIREMVAGYFIPNYIEAQEARSSDKERKRKSRERRRDQAMAELGGVTKRDDVSRNVTPSHDRSQNVTSGHVPGQKVTPTLPSLPSLADPPPPPTSSTPRLALVPPPVAPPKEEGECPRDVPGTSVGRPGDKLEPGEASPTAAELLELWADARQRWGLRLEAKPARASEATRLRYSRTQWVGAFDAYLDPKRSKGLRAAEDDWPLAALLAGGVLGRKAPKPSPRAILCGSCGRPASLSAAGQPIRTADGKATCYPCLALPTSAGGGR